MNEMSLKSTIMIPCPNPRCTGQVPVGDVVCISCYHQLQNCPKCDKLMDKTIGMCAKCGYLLGERQAVPKTVSEAPKPEIEETQIATAAPPVIVRFKSERRAITGVMAEAYRQTARAEADMVSAARSLERVRASFLTEKDALEIWKLLDQEIGTADASSLRPNLITLRAWFEQQLFSQQLKRLQGLFKRDAGRGWREWLCTFAEGLSRWRLLLCQKLVDASEPFPEEFYKPHDFKRAIRLIFHQRWTEVYPFFIFIAQQEFLDPLTRARLIITGGQVYLYHFRFLEQALTFFRQAEKLAPNQWFVLAALGSYYQEKNDLNSAQSYFEQTIQAASGQVDGYIGMGELAERQGNLEEARGWYQTAINRASDDSIGYTRLLRLYGRPENIERYDSYIEPLAERAIAVDETGKYAVYLDVGRAYSGSKRFYNAQQWYQKAIELDPSRVNGYTEKGFACLDEGENKYENAREAFQKAIEVAPESYLGYWGLGLLCERQERWAQAVDQYSQAAQRQTEFRSNFLSRIGNIQLKMEQYEQAEVNLFEAFRLEPANDGILIDLAVDYYKNQGKYSEAVRIFEHIRKIKGESYEASYQNRLGNVYFHEGKYEVAAQHYLKAISEDDKAAVYYSNLVKALQELRDWENARELWNRAPAVVKGEKAFCRQMSLIRNDEANEQFNRGEYGISVGLYEEAITFDAEAAVIYSNLANAWERHKEAGCVRIDRAIDAVRKAVQYDPANEEYRRRLRRFEEVSRLTPWFGEKCLDRLPVVTPIALEVAANIIPIVEEKASGGLSPELASLVADMRERILRKYGVRIPGIRVQGNNTVLTDGTYIIMLMEIPLVSGNILLDRRLSTAKPNELHALDIRAESATNPETGDDANWIAQKDWIRVQDAGLNLWQVVEYPVRHLQAVIERNLTEFVGNQEIHDVLEEHCADRVDSIAQTSGGLTALTNVVRALLAEQVPIIHFAKICEQFLELRKNKDSLIEIVEALRSLPEIRETLPGNSRGVDLFTLSEGFEKSIKDAIFRQDAIPVLAMEPEPCQAALTAVRKTVGEVKNTALLVEDGSIRPFLRKLVELEFPGLFILSRLELLPELTGQVIGEIKL